jgi:phosphatidylserine/phosphatidylglycerophosphate/cardiolipin synthase-like enzyme
MMSVFHQLSRPTLLHLATAIATERLTLPIERLKLGDYVPTPLQEAIAAEFESLDRLDMKAKQIAYMLRAIAQERQLHQDFRDRIDLVWTGSEVAQTESRDTKIVVGELFKLARDRVTISSYALDSSRVKHSRELFAILARQMDENPNLQVRLFLNIQRPYRNTEPEKSILDRFAHTFRQQLWPGNRFPEVFYDPRALELDFESGSRACLHAKCIIVDDLYLFITSANFTQAAHERNIEAGVLLTSATAAKSMRSQFEQLVNRGILKQLQSI